MARDLLPPAALRALARARAKPLSYVVRVLVSPGPRPRAVVVLGEAHVKLQTASQIGREVVQAFALRGVESFPVDRVALGRLLWVFVHGPRLLLRALTLGAVKGSTITEAKALTSGHTVKLEGIGRIPFALHVGSVYLSAFFAAFTALAVCQSLGVGFWWLTTIVLLMELHMLLVVPAWLLRRKPWAWVVHPFLAILGTRDRLMASGTLAMLETHREIDAAVVVMGRAHVAGYAGLLVDEHGFREVPVDQVLG